MAPEAKFIVAFSVLGLLWAPSRGAVAQDSEPPPSPGPAATVDGELPAEGPLVPEPKKRPTMLAGEVHGSLVFPIADDPLCPSGADCIFGTGGGIGGRVERRWPTGIALSVVYEAWFHDSSSVWEVSTLQMIGAGLRYFFMEEIMWHPYVGVQGGLAIFGDTLKASGIGGAVEPIIGIEWELSQTLAFTFALAGRMFLTSSFTTENDGVERAADQGVNAALSLRFGLAIMESP